MEIIKTNEKVLVWMHRTSITGQDISVKLGVTRQAVSKKLKENSFTASDVFILKQMGYSV